MRFGEEGPSHDDTVSEHCPAPRTGAALCTPTHNAYVVSLEVRIVDSGCAISRFTFATGRMASNVHSREAA
jgi:hypothetical protein